MNVDMEMLREHIRRHPGSLLSLGMLINFAIFDRHRAIQIGGIAILALLAGLARREFRQPSSVWLSDAIETVGMLAMVYCAFAFMVS